MRVPFLFSVELEFFRRLGIQPARVANPLGSGVSFSDVLLPFECCYIHGVRTVTVFIHAHIGAQILDYMATRGVR
jgi:hypothetical protein